MGDLRECAEGSRQLPIAQAHVIIESAMSGRDVPQRPQRPDFRSCPPAPSLRFSQTLFI